MESLFWRLLVVYKMCPIEQKAQDVRSCREEENPAHFVVPDEKQLKSDFYWEVRGENI